MSEKVQRVADTSRAIAADGERQKVAEVRTFCDEGSSNWVDWSIDQGVPAGASDGYPGWGYRVTFQPEGGLEYVLDTRGSTEAGRMYTVADLASGHLAFDTPHDMSGREFTWRLYWYGYNSEEHHVLLQKACLRVTTF